MSSYLIVRDYGRDVAQEVFMEMREFAAAAGTVVGLNELAALNGVRYRLLMEIDPANLRASDLARAIEQHTSQPDRSGGALSVASVDAPTPTTPL